VRIAIYFCTSIIFLWNTPEIFCLLSIYCYYLFRLINNNSRDGRRLKKAKLKKSAKKKECEKRKVPSVKEKKREFALFPPPTVEIWFQSPKPLSREESKGLE
jgi:hypothetical protein